MGTVTFDTLKFADKLEAAGLTRAQAAAIAEAQKESLGEVDVASKSDLREVELRMTIKVGAMLVAAVGVLIASMRAFIH